MIFIDLENKLPTDADIPNWEPWPKPKWEAWKSKSTRLVRVMARFEARGRLDWRNKLIDKYGAHWGQLKPWLEALSDGKCWFSDVRELYSHYDVEHFRPKKEAKALDGTVRDGYWWLAFEHLNFRLCGNVGNRKKGGWFPLRDGSACSTFLAPCEESEDMYFLDPICASDVSLIGFDDEGNFIPWPNASAWDAERVKETAKRLKLNEHRLLAEERRKIWQSMHRLTQKYENLTARHAKGQNPGAKQKAEEAAKQIKEMISSNKELSSVARCYLALSNKPHLVRLMV